MIGQRLAHYHIVEQIGAGGMGVVYRARDEHLNRDVAIKVLPAGTLTDEPARRRFRKEAEALSKLNHPNIQIVYDFDTQDGVDFLVVEFVLGPTLADKLAAGALPEKEIGSLGSQIAAALEEAHERGVVHRDLKPGNIKVTAKGQVKVLDFGLAKLLRPFSETAPTESLAETQAVAGTLPYMAPEQLRGEPADARSDLWAAGAVLYEMATGQRPFREELAPRLTDAILHQALHPPRNLNRRISPGLENIILKCLEKDPDYRMQSAKELLADLQRLAAGAARVAAPRRRVLARRWAVAAAAAVFVVLAGAAWQFYFRRAQALTETDHILLADFDNRTGDPVFDGTLKQALAVKLGESPFLDIIPVLRVRETLQLMQRAPDEPMTGAVAREVCQRQGAKALLDGSIAPLGSHYVINLSVQNCQSGDVLVQDQVEATRKEDVLSALGQASSRLRRKLGEALGSIQEYDTPITQATTASLEALKALSQGDAVRAQEGDLFAIPSYKRALELDPDFALAHARLAVAYSNIGESELSRQYHTKAFGLRDRLSEPERFYISALYYGLVKGEREKAIETYEMWKRAYPRAVTPYTNLGVTYFKLGQREKALEAFQEVLRRIPQHVVAYDNVGAAYLSLNRFQESRAVMERALEQGLDSADMRLTLYLVAFVQGDKEAMRQQVDWARGKPAEARMWRFEALAAEFAGKPQEARELFRRSVALAQQRNFAESVALSVAQEADMEAKFGNARRARQRAQAALKLGHGTRRVQWTVANALARGGDVRQAEALAEDLAKRFPTDTLLHAVELAIVRGLVELEQGNPRKAIEVLRPARAYEPNGDTDLYTNDIRGQAYLKMKMTAEAAAEFQTIVDNRGLVPVSAIYPLAHLWLGRTYALGGDTAQARQAYEAFFTLWKHAEPNIPILQQAKVEYERLQ